MVSLEARQANLEGTGRLESVALDSAPDSIQMQALVASVRRANQIGTPLKASTGANGIGNGKIKPILPPVIVRSTVLRMVERAIGLGLLETKVKGGWITLPGEDAARAFTAAMLSAFASQPSGLKGAGCRRDCAARRTLSHTVKLRKMLVFW